MSYKAVINARIVTPQKVINGTILYKADKIVKILEEAGADVYETEEVLDAGGAYAVPGGIDAHVHLGGFGDIPIADDFYSGSLGALSGGTTTVIDFCEPAKDESVRHCIEKRKKEAEKSAVDYAFHFVFTRDYKSQLRELDYIESEGISNFKLFTVYENTDLTVKEIEEILKQVRKLSDKSDVYTFLIHAEDKKVIESMEEKVEDLDESDMLLLAKTRPNCAEASAAREMKRLASETREAICIAHASAKETLELAFESDSIPFLLETCPHYLEFTQDKLKGEDGELYTMVPPLRKKEDQERLWDAIMKGQISIFSTDHCPYSKRNKSGKTWKTVPCGVDGIQIRMLYLFSEGVKKRGLSMRDYVRLTSENPAKFYHMFPGKGCLAAGSDADIVLISEEENTEITIDSMKGKIDHTIYEGKNFSGRIRAVIKSGKTVYQKGKLYAAEGTGNYISRYEDELF